MPRPKRTKAPPSEPVLRIPSPSKTRPASKNRNISSSRSPAPKSTSEDSADVVKKNAKYKRVAARKDAQMTGELAPEANGPGMIYVKPPGQKEALGLMPTTREAGYEVERQEKVAKKALATLGAQTGEQVEVVPSSASDEVDFVRSHKRPVRESSAAGAATRIPSSAPGSAMKGRMTPRGEGSVLALANFRRRPRQPSILQIGRRDAPIQQDEEEEPSSLEGDTNSGLFSDEGDFKPRDEMNTPLQISTIEDIGNSPALRKSSTPSIPATSSSRKRKFADYTGTKPADVRSQRLKSTPQIQVERSFQEGPITISDNVSESASSEVSPAESEPALPPNKPMSVATPPEVYSDTMAPPQSSSPRREKAALLASTSSNDATKPGAHTKKRTQPSRAALARTNTIKPLSTADLQSLMPRRRRQPTKQYGDYEIPTSDAEEPDIVVHEDNDELSYHTPKKRKAGAKSRITKAATAAKAKAKTTKTPATSKAKSKSKTSARKAETNSTVTLANPTASKSSRTYTRRASDKENLPEPESPSAANANDSLGPVHYPSSPSSTEQSSLHLAKKAKQELKKIAAKFAEVDEWEMEFEEITASGSSPRLRDAR